MRSLDALLRFLGRSRQAFAMGLAVLYAEGREALLRRSRARTALEELAVEQKKLEIATQRANNAIDLAKKIEQIKDPSLRERVRATLQADNTKLLPPPDGAAA
jgi:hypothetical protein